MGGGKGGTLSTRIETLLLLLERLLLLLLVNVGTLSLDLVLLRHIRRRPRSAISSLLLLLHRTRLSLPILSEDSLRLLIL